MANFPAAQWIEYCTKKAVPIMEIPVSRSLPIFCFVLFFHLFFPDDLFLFLFCTVTKLIIIIVRTLSFTQTLCALVSCTFSTCDI